jgi:hypothetical protein
MNIKTEVNLFYKDVMKRIKRKDNIIPFWILVSVIITGVFSIFSEELIKIKSNTIWEICALGSTLAYTIYLHKQFYKNGYFKCLGGNSVVILILINLPFFFLTTFMFLNAFCSFIEIAKWFKILAITFCFICYTFFNWMFYRAFSGQSITNIKTKKISNRFKNAVYSSDLPLTISYFILFLFSLFFSFSYEKNEQIEYFFSGAIAFKMFLSNTSWIFIDDDFYKKIEEIGDNWCCE